MADSTNAKPVERQNYLLYLISGALVVLIIMAIIGVIVGLRLISNANRTINTSSNVQVSPSPVLNPIPLKKFASDSAVVKLRKELIELRHEIDTMDYFEAQIIPPTIDSKIRIE